MIEMHHNTTRFFFHDGFLRELYISLMETRASGRWEPRDPASV
jgi:hypothetical protein